MRAAYLNQTINVIVAMLMVPLLLRYLDVSEYVLWSIFGTFGALTLQLEFAVQTVSTREISREFHAGNAVTLMAAVTSARKAYRVLSASAAIPFLAVGLLYVHRIGSASPGISAEFDWIIFIFAYAVNYYFGANNSILLGMANVSRYNHINSLTRVLNFFMVYVLLRGGFSITGLCASFALSVVLGCLALSRAATETLKRFHTSTEANRSTTFSERSDPLNVIRQAAYSLVSFALYRGSFLVAVTILPKIVVGAYALALQANTVLMAFAIVPVQVWLRHLMAAIVSGRLRDILRELGLTVVAANTAFILGSAALVFMGNSLLDLIDSKVALPGRLDLTLVCLAFLIELNILLLVNFLIARRNYRFVGIYVPIGMVAIAGATFLTLTHRAEIATLIVLPLSLQALVSLPLILRVTYRELANTP